jgi:hypothetical protein
MAMRSISVLAFALLLSIAACSAPPVLLNGSREGVVVRYSQAGATSADALAAATKHCAQYGRKAVQGDANLMTGDTFVSFTCQTP